MLPKISAVGKSAFAVCADEGALAGVASAVTHEIVPRRVRFGAEHAAMLEFVGFLGRLLAVLSELVLQQATERAEALATKLADAESLQFVHKEHVRFDFGVLIEVLRRTRRVADRALKAL